ncbi:MAG: DoxX family protein [Acidobacteriaceae bacterium]
MLGLFILAAGFIVAGSLHFVLPARYVAIMPPLLPAPRLLVAVSGAAEIAGGVGLLRPHFRRAAAWGLVLLLVAVFPANLYMALAHQRFAQLPEWALWLRLPLQIPLIWWAWLYTRRGWPAR